MNDSGNRMFLRDIYLNRGIICMMIFFVFWYLFLQRIALSSVGSCVMQVGRCLAKKIYSGVSGGSGGLTP